jgi:AI-2 transport system permease protein
MKNLKKFLHARESGSIIFLIILYAIVGIINPAFLAPESLMACLNDSVVFTLLAVGIAFVVLTGEIDVSIGAILGLSAAVGATMLRDGSPTIAAILVALVIGAVIGLINGLGVAYLNIPSLIFTLGINGVVRGLIYVYTNGAWVENLPAEYTLAAGKKLVGDLSVFYAVTIVVVLIFHWWTSKTRHGRFFTAVGDNIQGATLVGIPTKKTKVLAYVLCGLFAAAAGMIYTSRIGFITAVAGNGYEMKAIAACVIGGIALTGGQGSLLGAAIGAIIMSSISRILVFMGFSSDYDNSITGIMLIVIVVVTTVAQNRSIVQNRHDVLMARTLNAVKNDEKGGTR